MPHHCPANGFPIVPASLPTPMLRRGDGEPFRGAIRGTRAHFFSEHPDFHTKGVRGNTGQWGQYGAPRATRRTFCGVFFSRRTFCRGFFSPNGRVHSLLAFLVRWGPTLPRGFGTPRWGYLQFVFVSEAAKKLTQKKYPPAGLLWACAPRTPQRKHPSGHWACNNVLKCWHLGAPP